jgi:hypothetical protein
VNNACGNNTRTKQHSVFSVCVCVCVRVCISPRKDIYE